MLTADSMFYKNHSKSIANFAMKLSFHLHQKKGKAKEDRLHIVTHSRGLTNFFEDIRAGEASGIVVKLELMSTKASTCLALNEGSKSLRVQSLRPSSMFVVHGTESVNIALSEFIYNMTT